MPRLLGVVLRVVSEAAWRFSEWARGLAEAHAPSTVPHEPAENVAATNDERSAADGSEDPDAPPAHWLEMVGARAPHLLVGRRLGARDTSPALKRGDRSSPKAEGAFFASTLETSRGDPSVPGREPSRITRREPQARPVWTAAEGDPHRRSPEADDSAARNAPRPLRPAGEVASRAAAPGAPIEAPASSDADGPSPRAIPSPSATGARVIRAIHPDRPQISEQDILPQSLSAPQARGRQERDSGRRVDVEAAELPAANESGNATRHEGWERFPTAAPEPNPLECRVTLTLLEGDDLERRSTPWSERAATALDQPASAAAPPLHRARGVTLSWPHLPDEAPSPPPRQDSPPQKKPFGAATDARTQAMAAEWPSLPEDPAAASPNRSAREREARLMAEQRGRRWNAALS
jgi:hypothetical protein